MKVTVLVGGVGGARFLLGVKAALGLPAVGPGPQDAGSTPAHEITAVVNVGDDIWMHGLRISPDLDSCLYTLGGGIDPERGWGRAEETWTVREELAAYGAEPSWFCLGDRDIATHLVRTRMLRAGYPLSDVVTGAVPPLAAGGDAAARHRRPRRDARRRRRPGDRPGRERAIHFQEWWVRHRAELPAHRFVPVGAEEATVLPAARGRDPRRGRRAARAVEPGGEHRRAAGGPGDARRAARHGRPGRRPLADRGRAAGARDGGRVPAPRSVSRPRPRRSAGTTARAPTAGCSTAGWCTPATPRTCPVSRSGPCRC